MYVAIREYSPGYREVLTGTEDSVEMERSLADVEKSERSNEEGWNRHLSLGPYGGQRVIAVWRREKEQ